MKHLNKKSVLLLPNKLMKNISDPRNAKEHYQSFIIKKNRKSVNQSEKHKLKKWALIALYIVIEKKLENFLIEEKYKNNKMVTCFYRLCKYL